MIIEIMDKKITVANHGKPAGTYVIDDFDDEELKEEKAILISQLFTRKIDETGHIYDIITEINGILDARKLRQPDEYFTLAKELAREQVEKND